VLADRLLTAFDPLEPGRSPVFDQLALPSAVGARYMLFGKCEGPAAVVDSGAAGDGDREKLCSEVDIEGTDSVRPWVRSRLELEPPTPNCFEFWFSISRYGMYLYPSYALGINAQ